MKKILFTIYYKLFTKNKGLLKDEPDNRDYIFGAGIERKIIRPDGQWIEFLPTGELQKNPIETMSCTSQSLLNCIEIINKAKWGESKNYSDRFLAKCSGTTRYGNGMRTILETLRKYYGTVRENQWDGAGHSSWSKYYKSIPKNILNMAQLWIKEYELEYESVNLSKNAIMRALQCSPLYVAGFAWVKQDGLYRSYGRANHAFTIVGYKQNEYWLAFDSYSPFLKKLDWNYKFGAIKSIFLEKKKTKYNQQAINKLMKRGFQYIQRPLSSGQIYKLTQAGLQHLTAEQARDLGIRTLSNNKQLIGITENLYNDLIA